VPAELMALTRLGSNPDLEGDYSAQLRSWACWD